MNSSKTILAALLFFVANAFYVHAQQRAITSNGVEVILFNDGTWEYADRHNDYSDDILIEEGGSGKSAEIVIKNDLVFTLENGMLKNFRVLRGGTRLYDNMNGKLRKIGPYEIKYNFASERLEQVGPYRIKYDFSTDRVTQIGDYRIEYDFRTDRISRIGNTQFEYSFFNDKLTEIRGNTPGLRITIF